MLVHGAVRCRTPGPHPFAATSGHSPRGVCRTAQNIATAARVNPSPLSHLDPTAPPASSVVSHPTDRRTRTVGVGTGLPGFRAAGCAQLCSGVAAVHSWTAHRLGAKVEDGFRASVWVGGA